MTDEPTAPIEGEVITPNEIQITPEAVELGAVNRVGRPTDMTPLVVTKLIAAFNNGYNVTEACEYSDISRTTYYRWIKDDDQFSYKMSQAQSAPNRKAKEVVITAIDAGDANLAFRWLTVRDPDFKPRMGFEPSDGEATTEEKLKEFMDDTNDGAYPDANTEDDGGTEPPAEPQPESRGEVAESPTDIS